MGSSLDDLSAFPDDVKRVMGFALRTAQKGGKHLRAKPFKIQGQSGVMEIVDDFDGDTYRAVYSVYFPEFVYTLHAFQKKSRTGKKTSKTDVKMVERRLRAAAKDYEKRVKEMEQKNGKGQSD